MAYSIRLVISKFVHILNDNSFSNIFLFLFVLRIMRKYNASEPCSRLERAILCTNFVPGCVEETAGFYAVCRDECLSFFNSCNSSALFLGSEICMEYPKREGSQKLPVCKQNQWPRSENWQLPENPTKSTGTSGKTSLV